MQAEPPSIAQYSLIVERLLQATCLEGDDGFYFRMAEAIAALTRSKHGVVVVPGAPGMLRVVGCYGYPTAVLRDFPVTVGVVGRAYRQGKVELVPDTGPGKDPDYHSFDDSIRSELAVPVFDHSRRAVAAVLNVESERLGSFTDKDAILLGYVGAVMLRVRARLLDSAVATKRTRILSDLLDAMPDEVMVIDRHFRPVWANSCKRGTMPDLDSFLRLQGDPSPDTVFTAPHSQPPDATETCYWLVEKNTDRCLHCVCNKAMESRQPVLGVIYKPKNLDILVEISAVPLVFPDGQVAGCLEVVRHVTQREKVPSLTRILLTGLSEKQLLRSIVDCVHQHLGYDRARLYSLDSRAGELHGVVHAGEHPRMTEAIFQERTFRPRHELRDLLLKSQTAGLIEIGRVLAVDQSLGYWRVTFPEESRATELDQDGRLELEDVREIACTPLRSQKQRWVLFVDAKYTKRTFSSQDLLALTMFAKIASAALEAIGHNELRFRMAIVGETSVGLAHELSRMTAAGEFGSRLSPLVLDALAAGRLYLHSEPGGPANRAVARYLELLGSWVSSGRSAGMKGSYLPAAEKLETQLLKRSVDVGDAALVEIARILASTAASPAKWGRLLAETGNPTVPTLLSRITGLLVALEDRRQIAEEFRIYTEALRTAFASQANDHQRCEYVSDARKLIAKAVRIARKKARALGVDVQECGFEHEVPLEASMGQVFLAWLALLDNAVWAAGSAPGHPKRVLIEVRRERDKCVVAVRNTGARVPPEKIPLLFREPFTTKPNGTGLGLVFAADWLDSNGGEIGHDYDEATGMTSFISKLRVSNGAPPRSVGNQKRHRKKGD